jgi:hypothetical protein
MAETPPPVDELRELQKTARRLMVGGVLWLVYELPPTRFDRRNTPSLIFESEMTVRRVRDYPSGWRTLGDKDLFKLSENT